MMSVYVYYFRNSEGELDKQCENIKGFICKHNKTQTCLLCSVYTGNTKCLGLFEASDKQRKIASDKQRKIERIEQEQEQIVA